jgi:hypothetical protein
MQTPGRVVELKKEFFHFISGWKHLEAVDLQMPVLCNILDISRYVDRTINILQTTWIASSFEHEEQQQGLGQMT